MKAETMTSEVGAFHHPVVFMRDGGVFASSRDVAISFEKRHDNVLRDIDNILSKAPEGCLLKFEETSVKSRMPNGGERDERAFDMNRDGFTLLAMGFTGDKALHWKLLYIEAFNRMEAELRARAEAVPGRFGTPPSLEELKVKLGIVEKVKSLRGSTAADEMWDMLGLPAFAAGPRVGLPPISTGEDHERLLAQVEDFIIECTEPDENADVQARRLYEVYARWCKAGDTTPMTETRFGRLMPFTRYRRVNSSRRFYKGLRLKTEVARRMPPG